MRLKIFAGRKALPDPPPPQPEPSPLDVFVKPDSLAINKAGQDPRAPPVLQRANGHVLAYGAGTGLHTQFFIDRGCAVTITDGDPANVAAIRRRYPDHDVRCLDLDLALDAESLGRFDIVYCYGTLYHLQHPDAALSRMAS